MRPALGFRPYRHGDFDEIEPRADFAAEQAAYGWPLRHTPPTGHAWTLTRNGQPSGCGGFSVDAHGVWRAWAYLSRLARRELAHAVRMAERATAFMDRERGVPIEASALCENHAACRTLARLGFVVNGGGFTYDARRYVRLVREAR